LSWIDPGLQKKISSKRLPGQRRNLGGEGSSNDEEAIALGLLGAGAGTAGAAYTGNKDVTVPAETVVPFSLTAPLTVVQERR
jgi:hypothetical protein